MAKPPPSGPHSDIRGVNMDARAGEPNRDAALGTAEDIEIAAAESAAKPDQGSVSPGGK
jgi:hypothetical protein